MPSPRALVLPMLVVVAALGAGCHRDPAAIEKTPLLQLPASYLEKSLVLSHDGRAYAFITRSDEGERLVSSAGTSALHAEIAKPTFAAKSHRLFYWFRDGPKDQPTITFVADGTEIATDFIAAGETAFSDDASRWLAAGAARGPRDGKLGDLTLFVDGTPLARVPDLALPSFSRNAAHIAYLTAAERRVTLHVDGTAQRSFEPPTTGCGSAALAHAPEPDLPLRHIVRYLADGTLLIVTRDPDGWGVYVDGRRVASYATATIDTNEGECAQASTFTPRLLRVAEEAPVAFWWERVGPDAERWRVVRNGAPIDDVTCLEPWRRQPPEPSRDGAHVIYACAARDVHGANVAFVVRDGARLGPYDDVWGIAPTPSFAHVAYGAARGAGERPWSLFVDGEVRVSELTSVWRPRVSDDGATLAWEGTVDETGRGIFGVDARRLGSFDDVLWGPELETGDRVAWVVRRGRKITRVTVPLSLLREPRRPRAVRHITPATPPARHS